jgi:hypothetical protein
VPLDAVVTVAEFARDTQRGRVVLERRRYRPPCTEPVEGHPQWALRAFMDFQIPEDLCAGYGYPQLTDQAKRKILWENLLRLHGMDVAEARATLGKYRS